MIEMKEIFNEEFKAFLKEHLMYDYDVNAKSLEDFINLDPRWNPDVIKEDPCPHLLEDDYGLHCVFDEVGNQTSECEGPEECYVISKYKNRIKR